MPDSSHARRRSAQSLTSRSTSGGLPSTSCSPASRRHDRGVILEVGAVDDGLGADPARRLAQPLGRQRQAEVAPERVALREEGLIAVAEEVDGDDVVARHGRRTRSSRAR